jgi:hypothetical protein
VTCTCSCPIYATGSECKIKLCNLTDQKNNCFHPTNSTYCKYNCPHMCGYCDYLM